MFNTAKYDEYLELYSFIMIINSVLYLLSIRIHKLLPTQNFKYNNNDIHCIDTILGPL